MVNPILWYPVESFYRFPNQSDSRYNEQKLAISIVKESIYSYIGTILHGKYTKNFFIQAFPVAGKAWCM